MLRFTSNKAVDDGLSNAFEKQLHVDENTPFAYIPTEAETTRTTQFSSRMANKKAPKAEKISNGSDMPKHDILTNPRSLFLPPKRHSRIPTSSLLSRRGALHQQCLNQHHRRDAKSGIPLRRHYAPWAPTTSTTRLRGQIRNLTNFPPPHSPPPPTPTIAPARMRENPSPLSLGKRRRVPWSRMDDDETNKLDGLDTILEEEDDEKKEGEKREASGRFKRQRRT